MIHPPSPHPLDFDWRYDDATAQALAIQLRDSPPIVAIGAPTVARLLEATGVAVTLVDRQPIQAVRRQIVCDAADFIADRRYRIALVDPPWYPAQLNSWSEAAARAVGVGGAVFVSVWPAATRPSAATEMALTLKGFSQWAHICRNAATLRYATPWFETVAREYGKSTELSRSPLIGELIRLDVRAPPSVDLAEDTAEQWLRFAIDDYQLAIRRRTGDGPVRMEPVLSADGWRWPYVSARAPGIGQIDIWSSDGEVARLGSSERMIDAVRQALRAPDGDAFERALIDVPALLSWRIPRPPYRRLIEWPHRQ
jgi:hypothetical protein